MVVDIVDEGIMNAPITPEDLAQRSFDRLSDEDQRLLMESGFPGVAELFDPSNPENRRRAARSLFRWYFGAPRKKSGRRGRD